MNLNFIYALISDQFKMHINSQKDKNQFYLNNWVIFALKNDTDTILHILNLEQDTVTCKAKYLWIVCG